jgi:hypothetical protein
VTCSGGDRREIEEYYDGRACLKCEGSIVQCLGCDGKVDSGKIYNSCGQCVSEESSKCPLPLMSKCGMNADLSPMPDSSCSSSTTLKSPTIIVTPLKDNTVDVEITTEESDTVIYYSIVPGSSWVNHYSGRPLPVALYEVNKYQGKFNTNRKANNTFVIKAYAFSLTSATSNVPLNSAASVDLNRLDEFINIVPLKIWVNAIMLGSIVLLLPILALIGHVSMLPFLGHSREGTEIKGVVIEPSSQSTELVAIGKAIALHPFLARSSDELTVDEDDELQILDKSGTRFAKEPAEWVLVRKINDFETSKDCRIGIIPLSYVKILNESPEFTDLSLAVEIVKNGETFETITASSSYNENTVNPANFSDQLNDIMSSLDEIVGNESDISSSNRPLSE